MSGASALFNFAEGILVPKKNRRDLKDAVLGDIKLQDGSVLKDVKVRDFNLNAFQQQFSKLFWMIAVVLTFAYFWTIASDIYALYALYSHPFVPRRIFYAYLAFFAIGMLIFIIEYGNARDILNREDLSMIMVDDLAYNMFQARGMGNYGLIREIQKRLSITDIILIRCLSMMDNLRRMIFVTLPEVIILIIAVLYKNQIISDSTTSASAASSTQIVSVFISLIPYIIKFVILILDLKDAMLLFFVYPCLRCTILLTTKQALSLQDYISIRVRLFRNSCLSKI
jgi:hypothetical protein